MPVVPAATHVLWGRPDFDRRSESNSQSWSSGILDGVHIREESTSGSRVTDRTDPSVEATSSGRRSRNGVSSRPLPSASSPTGQVERAPEGRLMTRRPPQSLGDHGAEADSCGSDDDDARSEHHARPEGQPGGGECYNLELHDAGRCVPCTFFARKGGCINGDACRFCHIPHVEKKRARPCKAKRDRCRGIADTIQSELGQDGGERLRELTDRSSLQGGYMRSVIASRQKKEREKSKKMSPKDFVRTKMGEDD